MTFKYDYKPFGTSFTDESLLPAQVATDVGGQCLGHDGVNFLVIDHHFAREGNFPSASAAVLHLAPKIRDALSGCKTVTLITHKSPDFDAFCSLYLVRRILEGGIPHEGWEAYGLHPSEWSKAGEKRVMIDWYSPKLQFLPEERIWPVLLAAYASRVDNCKKLRCDRKTALHSVLYAGTVRGRNWEKSGAYDFFMEVENRVKEKRLNPLYDGIFQATGPYAPELAMLQLEEDHYRRDIARGRKCIVHLPVADMPFKKWYEEVQQTHLFDCKEKKALNSTHLLSNHSSRQADGIYIRDPECILFKEWARSDFENSSLGQGFTFTAIVYSGFILDSWKSNTSRYVFSIDPEWEDGVHIYPVWAKLQAAEYKDEKGSEPKATVSGLPRGDGDEEHQELKKPQPNIRLGYEKRLEDLPNGNDPWFDGCNYKCTIVENPHSGTNLRCGVLGDLSDDEPSQIVRSVLEWRIYSDSPLEESDHHEPCVVIWDFPIDKNSNAPNNQQPFSSPIQNLVSLENAKSALRFASIGFHGKVATSLNTSNPAVADSIGRTLWPAIADEGVTTVPKDFSTRHLWHDRNSVMVWNRCGIAIACSDKGFVVRQKSALREIAGIIAAARDLSNPDSKATSLEEATQKGKDLLQKIISLKAQAAEPGNTVLRRLMDATQVAEIVQAATFFNQERFEEERASQQKKRDNALQLIIAVGTAIGLLFAWNQVEALSMERMLPGESSQLSAWMRFAIGVATSALFLFGYWLISRGQTKELFEQNHHSNSTKK